MTRLGQASSRRLLRGAAYDDTRPHAVNQISVPKESCDFLDLRTLQAPFGYESRDFIYFTFFVFSVQESRKFDISMCPALLSQTALNLNRRYRRHGALRYRPTRQAKTQRSLLY